MRRKTVVIFVILFAIAIGLNIFSRFRNFSASLGPIGDGSINLHEKTAVFGRQEIVIPSDVLAEENEEDLKVLGEAAGEKWIEVDLSEQKLRAWQGESLFLESLVSTGLSWYKTPEGQFNIWIKLRSTKMEGGTGKYYYNLPNVPYTMFFENEEIPGWRGFGLHGTYWHSDFGTVHSHGCVNLPTDIAKKLYYWVSPNLGENRWSVRATENNPGTRIVIHE